MIEKASHDNSKSHNFEKHKFRLLPCFPQNIINFPSPGGSLPAAHLCIHDHQQSLELPGVCDDDVGTGGSAGAAPEALDVLDELPGLLVGHPPEDDVLPVQPVRHHSRDEELGTVRVLAGVGHGEEAWKKKSVNLRIGRIQITS